MSGEKINATDMREILKRFGDTLERHTERTDRALQNTDSILERTDKALEKLAEAVESLTKAHIETKKDREFDSARMERIETTQREQSIRAKVVSDTVLLLDERVGNQKDKWIELGKLVSAVVSAVIIAKVLPL